MRGLRSAFGTFNGRFLVSQRMCCTAHLPSCLSLIDGKWVLSLASHVSYIYLLTVLRDDLEELLEILRISTRFLLLLLLFFIAHLRLNVSERII